jgi:hypothetical protein
MHMQTGQGGDHPISRHPEERPQIASRRIRARCEPANEPPITPAWESNDILLFDTPAAIPSPRRDRRHAPLAMKEVFPDEWRRPPVRHAAGQRCRCLLRQSRHVRNAFRRGARPQAADALRARPVRGRSHRRGRRLRPHGRQTGGDAAALRARHGQRPRQHAQRQARLDPDDQRGRRPCDLPSPARCTVDQRHREPGPADVAIRAPHRLA